MKTTPSEGKVGNGWRREIQQCHPRPVASIAPPLLIGRSPVMQRLYQQVHRIASANRDVLIQGETGSGKEVIAQAIHCESARAGKPFVAVNCASVTGSLFESEFFGAERGAYTGAKERKVGFFEQASGGTLFLDEISEIEKSAQAVFLRALEQRLIRRLGGKQLIEADLRVISATNHHLQNQIRKGQFRADLYYRLAKAVLKVPPLREHPEDIPDLIDYLIQKHAMEYGGNMPRIEPKAVALLKEARWPGNIRQLENVIGYAMLQTQGASISRSVIAEILNEESDAGDSAPLAEYIAQALAKGREGESKNVLGKIVMEVEREAILQALRLAQGKQNAAAKMLGIHRNTLHEKLKQAGPDRHP